MFNDYGQFNEQADSHIVEFRRYLRATLNIPYPPPYTPADRLERTFAAMQSGSNPCTNAEINRLAAKYPDRWNRFIGRGV